MRFNDPTADSYRAFRFPYPPQSQAITATALRSGRRAIPTTSLAPACPSPSTAAAAVTTGSTVTCAPYAPVNPQFNETAPCVLPIRVSFSENDLPSLNADFAFSTNSLGYANPANLTVYYRSQTGSGVFAAQPTSYNPVLGQLITTLSLTGQGGDFGEVIFGYPDVAQVAYPPILNTVETYPGVQPNEVIAPGMAVSNVTVTVNQQWPIWLSWSPVGFAGWYYLQIATTPDFASPVVDIPYQTDAYYVWNGAAPNTTYYWRVNTSNDGGESDWATNSFATVPPIDPNDLAQRRRGVAAGHSSLHPVERQPPGESWRSNYTKVARWSNPSPPTPPSTGAYQVDPRFQSGSRQRLFHPSQSTTNAAMSAFSAANFSIIDQPVLSPGAVTRVAERRGPDCG